MNKEQFFTSIQGKTVTFCGIGRSHMPLIRLFQEKGALVSARDKRSLEELGDNGKALQERGVQLILGENYLEDLREDIIFRTPGMKYHLPQLEAARKRGAAVTSEMEVFFQLCPCKIYAVTGSDGKTTTTSIIAELLKAQGKTLATAESCTGGLLSKRLTDVSGASEVFHMGVVTYANQAKEDLLSVSHETLEQYGAVSPQTAREMAEGIVRRSGSSLGVGITGIAGPDGGTAEKPVGLIYIALSDGEHTWVTKRNPIGRTKSREWHRHCAASQALDMVRRYLEGLPVEADY